MAYGGTDLHRAGRAPSRAHAQFAKLIAPYTGSTWLRWLDRKSRVPLAVTNLLKILRGGELPQGGKEWAGWKFHKGKLYDPAGQWHTPGTILVWHWTMQELNALRAAENRAENAGGNVVIFPGRRSARIITAEINRRLRD
jgi:hypothetical protein